MMTRWIGPAYLLFALHSTQATDRSVRFADELRDAVAVARPGERILLAPGRYPGGFLFPRLRGEAGKPIVIAAADSANPPIFSGGSTAIHLTDPEHVELRDLLIERASGNGLNIDDGGSYETPAHHVVLRNLTVRDIGRAGNHDGIKLSGVVDFHIEGCVIERWGTGGGSGIDMVGCHRGLMVSNRFEHTDQVNSTAVQAKGGSSEIVIRRNQFKNAGGRGVNIGGSTGLQYFRPPLKSGGRPAEARQIVVEGNTFAGGGCAVAFVGVDGATVQYNTIYHPARWAMRILQENRAPGFVRSRGGRFMDNVIVFDSGHWSEGGVNIGPNTDAGTFQFTRNWWYCANRPERSRPSLPTTETEGVYGGEPRFRDSANGDLRQVPESPARRAGADGWRE
jgi:hypothetical protein